LRSLVSRDRSNLTADLAAAAAIESLAENLSDSVVAPLFYYALFGLPGAALYRLCNTLDSMIGYRGRYEYLGKASARLDDILNLLPSRLTALLIIGLAPFFGGKWRNAWRIWRRDAGKTASPNAGHPMSAAAGALRIQLEKVDHYTLGDNEKIVSHTDIKRAEKMVWCVGGMAIVLCCLFRVYRRHRA
jgi:adenosylcobinamide-phosphate synthase